MMVQILLTDNKLTCMFCNNNNATMMVCKSRYPICDECYNNPLYNDLEIVSFIMSSD